MKFIVMTLILISIILLIVDSTTRSKRKSPSEFALNPEYCEWHNVPIDGRTNTATVIWDKRTSMRIRLNE